MIDIAGLLGIVLAAGIVRGYSGFGFSALVLLTGSLLVAPQTLVPVLYLLELSASLWLLRNSHGAVNWQLLLPLMLGSALGNPVGQSWLVQADDTSLMTAISLAIGSCCLLLWKGFSLPTQPKSMLSFCVGGLAGLINGMGSVGGLVVAVYLMATRQNPSQIRTTMAMQLLILSAYGLLGGLWLGLIDTHTWQLAALGLPALMLGMFFGGLLFRRSEPTRFRNALLLLLTVLSLTHPLSLLLTV